MQNKILHRINFIFIFLAINILSAQDISSQITSFTIGQNQYYLHKIAETDLRDIDPSKAYWNQSIVADKDYIYIADNTNNNFDTDNTLNRYLTVKRFSAVDGTPAKDLTYDNLDSHYYLDAIKDEYHGCFYLVDCHDDEHFLIFLTTPKNGIELNDISFTFFVADKHGKIHKEYDTLSNQVYIIGIKDGIARIGVPAINGDITSGNFKLIVPIVDYYNHLFVLRYQYNQGKGQTSVNVIYNNTANAYTKPVISIIDDNNYLLDDICTKPLLLPYDSSAIGAIETFPSAHVKANGVHFFSALGHNFLASCNLQFADEADITTGTSSYDIGVWDTTVAPATRAEDNNIDFSGYQHLTSIPTGKSIIEDNTNWYYYSYRQFAATSDYGAATHIHLYTPGQSLATYQLNRNDIPTSVSNITAPSDFNITLRDRTLLFSQPTSGISIYDIAGRLVINQCQQVDKLSLANLGSGVYIVKTPLKTQKIIL